MCSAEEHLAPGNNTDCSVTSLAFTAKTASNSRQRCVCSKHGAHRQQLNSPHLASWYGMAIILLAAVVVLQLKRNRSFALLGPYK
ncbi:hypothetical protein niasHT_000919 [Heterodera trifolii]|uniref:Uncharacterized protein n=1 Tax=Heterodera trifolii TaxID=157864 RepID=A0ABD2LR73_9BILA